MKPVGFQREKGIIQELGLHKQSETLVVTWDKRAARALDLIMPMLPSLRHAA